MVLLVSWYWFLTVVLLIFSCWFRSKLLLISAYWFLIMLLLISSYWILSMALLICMSYLWYYFEHSAYLSTVYHVYTSIYESHQGDDRYGLTAYGKYLVAWWRHQMETFSALLAICAGNSPVSDEFPAQRPVTRSFDVFSDLRLNKRLSKQSWGWWFETLSRPLWRHCNGIFSLLYVMNDSVVYMYSRCLH